MRQELLLPFSFTKFTEDKILEFQLFSEHSEYSLLCHFAL